MNSERIGRVGLSRGGVCYAMTLRMYWTIQIGARDVQAVHDDVTRAQAVDGCRQGCGYPTPIDEDDQRGFLGIIETLTDAHAKKGWVLLHQDGNNLLFYSNRLADDR